VVRKPKSYMDMVIPREAYSPIKEAEIKYNEIEIQ
jgi:hypothetical protein